MKKLFVSLVLEKDDDGEHYISRSRLHKSKKAAEKKTAKSGGYVAKITSRVRPKYDVEKV